MLHYYEQSSVARVLDLNHEKLLKATDVNEDNFCFLKIYLCMKYSENLYRLDLIINL